MEGCSFWRVIDPCLQFVCTEVVQDVPGPKHSVIHLSLTFILESQLYLARLNSATLLAPPWVKSGGLLLKAWVPTYNAQKTFCCNVAPLKGSFTMTTPTPHSHKLRKRAAGSIKHQGCRIPATICHRKFLKRNTGTMAQAPS